MPSHRAWRGARHRPGHATGPCRADRACGPGPPSAGRRWPAIEQRATEARSERLGHRGRLVEAGGDRAIAHSQRRSLAVHRTGRRGVLGQIPGPVEVDPGQQRGSGDTPRGGPRRSARLRSVPIIRRARAFSSSRGRTGGRVCSGGPAAGSPSRRTFSSTASSPRRCDAPRRPGRRPRRRGTPARGRRPAAGTGRQRRWWCGYAPARRPTGTRRRRRSAGPASTTRPATVRVVVAGWRVMAGKYQSFRSPGWIHSVPAGM